MSAVRYESCPQQGVVFHEFANLFPMLTGEAFDALVDDIAANGVQQPIVMLGNAILDGRNRFMAARQLGIEYPVKDYQGDDPLAFVVSHNLARRHLSESQRAMVAKKVATMKQGRPGKAANLPNISQADAARLLNVSERSIRSAAKVQSAGDASLIEAVEAGKVTVSAAASLAELPKAEQEKIVVTGTVSEIRTMAKRINAARTEARRKTRLAKHAEIRRGDTVLGTDVRYPVVYADPPWRYHEVNTASDRAVENHYPTMTQEELCALPVGKLAADDAALFMWATATLLPEAMEVIDAWGFRYVGNLVWDKQHIGLGSYVRVRHEHLMIAIRGDFPAPPAAARPASIYTEPRGKHSAKPHHFYGLIDQLYPGLAKIELFCRTPQPGWAVWGNESGGTHEHEARVA